MRPPFWAQLAGVFLIAVGMVLLLNALGIALVAVVDVLIGAGAVVLIIMGLRLLRRSRWVRREPFVDILMGSIRRGSEWEVTSAQFAVGIGQVRLDLTGARVPPGEHHLLVDCILGSVRVVLPADVGVAVSCRVGLGEIVAFGQRWEGINRSLTLRTPDYEKQSRRIALEASATIGQIHLSRPAAVEVPQALPALIVPP
ncbi:MAG: cell wall-active antibiotics response protein LiaF [Dehalococcoidia bacterium]|nr:cell wall-active antibiotics response protein LiaF [Dehalococcoidia bacterium]MDW8120544.1 cell wall-active antibiotics response protein LiaF [Chloroflexota bacterium]